jgi:hypothetical protein
LPEHGITGIVRALLVTAAAADLYQSRCVKIKSFSEAQPVDVLQSIDSLFAGPAGARAIYAVLDFPFNVTNAFTAFVVEAAYPVWKRKIHLESIDHFVLRAGQKWPHPRIVVVNTRCRKSTTVRVANPGQVLSTAPLTKR